MSLIEWITVIAFGLQLWTLWRDRRRHRLSRRRMRAEVTTWSFLGLVRRTRLRTWHHGGSD